MSVRPRAPATDDEIKQGCCSRCCERLCEVVIAAVKRRRKRRERKRLREELEQDNLVVRKNVVSTLDGAPIGKVKLRSGQEMDVGSILLFRPTFRERFRSIRIVSLRSVGQASLIGNIECIRGAYLPRPPLDVAAATSSGISHCFDQRVEAAIKVVVKRASF